MKHLVPMIAVLGMAFALGGCRREPPPADPADPFTALQARLQELDDRRGPDLAIAPELEGIIRDLERLPDSHPHYTDAIVLAGTLKARRRAGLQAIDARPRPQPWREEVRVQSFGPLRMDGEQPQSRDEAARVEALKVGDSRAHLLATLGGCLVRQTWFRGKNGGPTIELFQVAPDCRDRFQPRIFSVKGDQVSEIQEGDLDGLMTPPPAPPAGSPAQ